MVTVLERTIDESKVLRGNRILSDYPIVFGESISTEDLGFMEKEDIEAVNKSIRSYRTGKRSSHARIMKILNV